MAEQGECFVDSEGGVQVRRTVKYGDLLTRGAAGVRMETPVTMPSVPSAPINSCLRS